MLNLENFKYFDTESLEELDITLDQNCTYEEPNNNFCPLENDILLYNQFSKYALPLIINEDKERDIFPIQPINTSDIKNQDSTLEKTTKKTKTFQVYCGKKLVGRKKLTPDNNNGSKDIYDYNDNEVHSKLKPDNIMRKIKANLFENLIKLLNQSLRNKQHLFCKLDKTLNEDLKKDHNIELMNRTIFDIIFNTKISDKYKNKKNSNQNLIIKILEENKEYKAINILSLKFIDFINCIRNNKYYLEDFLEKIKIKEYKVKQDKNTNKEIYMQKVEELFFKYEKWFFNKNSRNCKKGQTNNNII